MHFNILSGAYLLSIYSFLFIQQGVPYGVFEKRLFEFSKAPVYYCLKKEISS